MIEEAQRLGAAEVLRVDAVKSLQQRWQAEAHRVPIDRRQEQKLWDAFRKPIDDAFNRKSAEREKAEAALSIRDKTVLDAAKALEQANAAADAVQIRAAMAALDAALKGQAQAQAEVKDAGDREVAAKDAVSAGGATSDESGGPAEQTAPTEVAPPAVEEPKPARKPVVAVRGDDRPGMKKDAAPAAPARGGKWNDRKDAPRAPRERDDRVRANPWQEAPRLGDTAFRAQREALENAQAALKRLAAQAHGEALSQLMTAWEKRDSALLPSAQELGARVSSGSRVAWQRALGTASVDGAVGEYVLRLEMAAEVPTPAEHLSARRAMQLQLLTRRNDPAPAQTWEQDVARVLGATFSPEFARRVQNALKILLKR
jgi:hypothetical protein